MSESKEILTRMSKRFPGCYEVYYEGGGELPKELANAAWTTEEKALRAIEDYVNNRKRGAKSGSTRSKPRTD